MASYDILGNIVLFKFPRKTSMAEKKKIALAFLKKHGMVRTALEKSGKFSGRLRTHKGKYIAGESTKEVLYKENGCVFRFNVDTCYFSPRLSSERAEIAGQVKKGESVLVLFAGVAPFSVVIAKTGKPSKVVSIELGRECSKYALENVKRNKVNVEVVQGDVRRLLPKMKDKFDKIVMARPNLKDSFLDVTFPRIKKSGIIYYYGFYEEEKKQEMIDMIKLEAKKARKKIKILGVKKAGDIGVRKYRYRVDIRVMN